MTEIRPEREPRLFDDRRRYTIAEAARLWGCSTTTLRDIVRERPWMLANNKVLMKWQLKGIALNRVYYGTDELDERGVPKKRQAVLQRMF